MKALKHSPEYAGPPKTEIAPVPFSHMPSIHAHVVGFDRDGRRYESHRGQGPETFFWRMPNPVSGQKEVDSQAAGLVNLYSRAYDLHQEEERQKAAEKAKPVVFKDNRDNRQSKGGKKPFNKQKSAPVATGESAA